MNAFVTLTEWPAVVFTGGQQLLPAPAAIDVFGLDVFDFQVQVLSIGAGATNLYIEGSMQNQLDDNTLWTILYNSSTPAVGMNPVRIPAVGSNFGSFRYLRWRLAGTLTGPSAYSFFIRGIGRNIGA